MARFNSSTATKTNRAKTVNMAGGSAYVESNKLELVSILLTSFVQDQYYESAKDNLHRLSRLIKETDPLFVAKGAIYARNEFGLRSITHATAGELSNVVKGQTWFKSFIEKVVHRPDDALEILSYFLNTYGVERKNKNGVKVKRNIPNALKKGLSLALQKFNEYSLAKYRGEGKDVSMVDLVNLCHPKSTPAISALMKGTLKPAETWEVALTQAGQTATTDEEKSELKAEAWESLLSEEKLGYFAALRNCRNIIQQAPQSVDKLCSLLVNKKAIRKSLVLPFRIYTAIKTLKNENVGNAGKVLKALSKALDISLVNIPKLNGKSIVIVDHSGSMSSQVSSKSVITRVELGALFGSALAKSNDADLMIFGSTASYLTFNPADSVATLTEYINETNNSRPPHVGHGTDFDSTLKILNQKYDRIFYFSDMQGWMSGGAPDRGFANYCKKYSANPFIYSIDLCGYGTLQFPQDKIFCLAGFSEKIFDLMRLLEEDREVLVNTIEKVTI